MESKPTVSVGNPWLCQAPYGCMAGQTHAIKQVKDGAEAACNIEGMQRRNVLIGTCQINATCTPHKRALSRRSCLNWWKEEVRKRRRAIGRVCWWWCAAENWCWDGLTGSVSVHSKTVIQSDRVVFPPLHKGYAIASSLHDTMNEPQPLKPETLIRSVWKCAQARAQSIPHLRVIYGEIEDGSHHFLPCLRPIVRLRLHFRNDVLGNRVCWAVSSGCMILPAWLKSARELLAVPVHLLQLLVWSILDSFAQGCVCILTAESHRNKEKRRGNR